MTDGGTLEEKKSEERERELKEKEEEVELFHETEV